MFDLVIRGALIVDGSGAERFHGDLAVRDGRIAEIGPGLGAGNREIDAAGRVLAPGIIDTHTHYDAQVTWDPALDASVALGVTSVVLGNCGFTIAPCRSDDRDLTMRNLVKVEGMSLAAMRAGITWEFESFPEYIEMLRARELGVNVAAFLGHSSLRTYVLGAQAQERAATPEEVATMSALVREAMAAGALGFATSTSPSHNGDGGYPMPSRLATEEELAALVSAMGESGRGIFMLTKGGNTSISFLEDVAARSGRPIMVAALLHNSTRPDAVFSDLDAITQANQRGRELYGQVSCCPLTMDFSIANPYPLEGISAWEPALTASEEALPEVLARPAFRDAVKQDLLTPLSVRLFNGEWHKLSVVETVHPDNRWMEGQSLEALAQEKQQHPLDVMLDLALSENLATQFTAVLLNSDEEAVAKLLRHPHSAIALSDAGAHLTFFCDTGFGLRLLGYWARERSVLSLEQAVWRLSGQPAQIFRIPQRGRLAPGYWADLMLFDPDKVNRSGNRRAFDLPAAAARLMNDPIGVHGVWVNGVQRVDESGAPIAAAGAGRVLRHFDG